MSYAHRTRSAGFFLLQKPNIINPSAQIRLPAVSKEGAGKKGRCKKVKKKDDVKKWLQKGHGDLPIGPSSYLDGSRRGFALASCLFLF